MNRLIHIIDPTYFLLNQPRIRAFVHDTGKLPGYLI
ncbi:hypothetical protein SAMN05216308_1258 [Nitrosospira sp. Nsp13]|nr:hypothetical protein SAMN05216308_1258 [Nitrosospira sp. Nsp13]